jgi:hypothetical protein
MSGRSKAWERVARLLLPAVVLLAAIRLGVGATNVVTNPLDDNSAGSLRVTIAASAPNDVVTFAPGLTGIISLTNGELFVSNNLAILGPGATNLVISGNKNSRVFNIIGQTVTISGLTIADGVNRSTGSAAGIYNFENGGELVLASCIISNNVNTTGGGGGLLCVGSLSASNCVFLNNSAIQGGGMDLEPGPAARCVLNNCLVSSNAATGLSVSGGGISAGGALTLTNCTISGNAGTQVGALALLTTNVYISSCTICSNSCSIASTNACGGIHCGAFGIGIENSLIADNISAGQKIDVRALVNSRGFNLIGSTNGGGGWAVTDLKGSTNSPLEPLLGPLQDNGGPTFTHALLPGSPAIDAGNGFGITTDQRGRSRPYDLSSYPNAAGGDGSDIGAFELIPPTLRISIAGDQQLLCWPLTDAGYTLVAAPDLVSTTWTPVAATVAMVGNNFLVTNSVATNAFFRLRAP